MRSRVITRWMQWFLLPTDTAPECQCIHSPKKHIKECLVRTTMVTACPGLPRRAFGAFPSWQPLAAPTSLRASARSRSPVRVPSHARTRTHTRAVSRARTHTLMHTRTQEPSWIYMTRADDASWKSRARQSEFMASEGDLTVY